MMKLLIPLFFLVPNVVLAEPLSIRSGDHDTFSRLVLTIPEGSVWGVTQIDNGYSLNISGNPDGFDISQIFERISRERIEAVIQKSPSDLDIFVQCQCYIDTFLWRPDRLVLDVIEGDPPNDARIFSLENIVPELSQLDNILPAPMPQNQILVEDQFFDNPIRSDEEISNSEEVRSVETALIEGLARAATQGFLDAAAVTVLNTNPLPETKPEALNLPADIPLSVSPHPGVDVSTVLDRDLALLGQAIDSGQNCLPMELFNIRGWAGTGPFHEQVAPLVIGLTGEFGQEPAEAYERLAQLYIYFGFGAEAISVLSVGNSSSQSRNILRELAIIIDESIGEVDTVLSQASCENAGKMWAFILDPVPLGQEQAYTIQNHFRDLPTPLRGQIAPRLAQSFLHIGDAETANLILDAFQVGDVASLHRTIVARAEISRDLDNGDVIPVLTEEAQGNPRTTPESIIKLIELAIEEGQSPSDGDILLIATMRQEYQNDAISNELLIAEAKGRSARGEYREALELINGLSGENFLLMNNYIYNSLAEKAVLEVFLEHAYSEIPDGLSYWTENKIARRLLDIGFPSRASEFLQSPQKMVDDVERLHLMAEIALLQSRYQDALSLLVDVEGEKASEIRTMAQVRLNSMEGMPTNEVPIQQVNNMEQVLVSNDNVNRQSGIEFNTLAARRAILEQAIESRRAVESLLDGLELESR